MKTMLEWKGVTVRYGQKIAAENVSLEVREGDWLMLCGPNGSGKTTLVEAAGGVLPYEGSILLNGGEVRGMKSVVRARQMAVLCQNSRADGDFTVAETVALGLYASRKRRFFPSPDGEERVAEALEMTGLSAMAGRRMTELSGGESQRVHLAQVLAQNADVLLLDEAARSLDLRYQKEICDLVRAWLSRGGRCAVSVEHDLDLCRLYGTHCALIARGRITAFGRTRDVMTAENLAGTFDMDVDGWMRQKRDAWK